MILILLASAVTACGSPTDPVRSAAAAEQADQERLDAIAREARGWSDEEAQRAETERLRQVSSAEQAEHPGGSAEDDALAASGDLPDDRGSLLVRTDFTHQSQWDALVGALQTPSPEGFSPSLLTVEHPRWAGVSVADLAAAAPPYALLVVADATTLTSPDMPLLVIDVGDGAPRELRVTPPALASVENNLSIANMDWEEFAGSADPDGVFRGFR